MVSVSRDLFRAVIAFRDWLVRCFDEIAAVTPGSSVTVTAVSGLCDERRVYDPEDSLFADLCQRPSPRKLTQSNDNAAPWRRGHVIDIDGLSV